MAMTPYQASKAANAARREAGLSGSCPPQMFYNYTSGRAAKGKVPFIPFHRDKDGKPRIEEKDFAKWLAGYIQSAVVRTY